MSIVEILTETVQYRFFPPLYPPPLTHSNNTHRAQNLAIYRIYTKKYMVK